MGGLWKTPWVSTWAGGRAFGRHHGSPFRGGRLLDTPWVSIKRRWGAIEDTVGLHLRGAIEDKMGLHLRGRGHRRHHGSVIKVVVVGGIKEGMDLRARVGGYKQRQSPFVIKVSPKLV